MPTLEKGYTTLNIIKSHKPCFRGWETLLKGLNKKQADDDPLHILTLLNINGWADTCWAFKCFNGIEKELRLFAADCAEAVLPIFESKFPNDERPRLAIEAARKFANGELDAATDAAADAEAARAAVYNAAAAAYAATTDAARAAATAAAAPARAAAAAARAADAAAAHAAAAALAAALAADAASDAASDAAATDAVATNAAAASHSAYDAALSAYDAAAAASRAAQIENFKSYFNK